MDFKNLKLKTYFNGEFLVVFTIFIKNSKSKSFNKFKITMALFEF